MRTHLLFINLVYFRRSFRFGFGRDHGVRFDWQLIVEGRSGNRLFVGCCVHLSPEFCRFMIWTQALWCLLNFGGLNAYLGRINYHHSPSRRLHPLLTLHELVYVHALVNVLLNSIVWRCDGLQILFFVLCDIDCWILGATYDFGDELWDLVALIRKTHWILFVLCWLLHILNLLLIMHKPCLWLLHDLLVLAYLHELTTGYAAAVCTEVIRIPILDDNPFLL